MTIAVDMGRKATKTNKQTKIADPGVLSLIPPRAPYTFVEIDHEIISTWLFIEEGLLSVTSGNMCTEY